LYLTFIFIFHFSAIPFVNHLGDNCSINSYFKQSVYFKWQNQFEIVDIIESDGQMQGLLVPELELTVDGKSWKDSFFYIGLSMIVQVYDIYNFQFAPINLNLNKMYLEFKANIMKECFPKGIQWHSVGMCYFEVRDMMIPLYYPIM